jgi:Mce-associated membrane protein
VINLRSLKNRASRQTGNENAVERSETDTLTEQDSAATDTTDSVEGRTATINTSGEDTPSAGSENNSDAVDDVVEADSDDQPPKAKTKRPITWAQILPYAVLPALALLLAAAAGYLKWQEVSDRTDAVARIESVAAAKDATTAILSYTPETAGRDLDAAGDRLTGAFKDSYAQLTRDVVIPGARQKHISAVAKVPGVASVAASSNHAVVLLYVDQTIVVGSDPPSDTVSSVRVTLTKTHDRWLVSEFDPI